MYSPSEKDIAYHEAGHAVTAMLFYKNVTKVTIIPSVFEGLTRHGNTMYVMPMPLEEIPNEKNFDYYLKVIITLLAGKYFQAVSSGVYDKAGAIKDYEQLVQYTHASDDSGQVFNLFENKQEVFTYEFCNEPIIKQTVTEVAEQLIIKKELNQDDLKQIIGNYSIDPQVLLERIKGKYMINFLRKISAT
jgi:hypothetical protein